VKVEGSPRVNVLPSSSSSTWPQMSNKSNSVSLLPHHVRALVGVLIKRLYEMHGAAIKIVNAQQAKLDNYRNTKLKLLKTNAALWFNKMCKS